MLILGRVGAENGAKGVRIQTFPVLSACLSPHLPPPLGLLPGAEQAGVRGWPKG